MGENTGKPGQTAVTAPQPTPAEDVRALTRRALTGSLATLDQATGHPYASLVLVATAADGAPLLLLSGLARHTRNLMADSRASLLVDGTAGSGDPLAGGRATLIGHITPLEGSHAARARTRFLARHPASAGYADFADFGFFALVPERAHYVGGFGRIVEVPAHDILVDTRGAEALLAAEADILAQMNEAHAAALSRYAKRRFCQDADSWRMSGIDTEGLDLVADGTSARLVFAKRVVNPDDACHAIADLAVQHEGLHPGPRRG
jgi:putative heme iron utilization protein